MNNQRPTDTRSTLAQRLGRFFLGLIGLALFAGVFASGWTPPGMAGDVLRHNQQHEIDASPLFYSEVDHMAELEKGVQRLRERASKRTLGETEKEDIKN